MGLKGRLHPPRSLCIISNGFRTFCGIFFAWGLAKCQMLTANRLPVPRPNIRYVFVFVLALPWYSASELKRSRVEHFQSRP